MRSTVPAPVSGASSRHSGVGTGSAGSAGSMTGSPSPVVGPGAPGNSAIDVVVVRAAAARAIVSGSAGRITRRNAARITSASTMVTAVMSSCWRICSARGFMR